MALVQEIKRSNFDTTLYNMPAFLGGQDTCFDLYIYLRVHLRQMNPPAGTSTFQVRNYDNRNVECARWTDAAWETFTTGYLSGVNSFWDSAFRLITPTTHTGLDWPLSGAGRRRNVNCRFQLSLNLTSSGSHVSIPVVQLAPAATSFRSHSLLYSDRDLNADTYRSDTGRLDWNFFTTTHEVGHLLGLGHSNETSRACRNNPNSAVCLRCDA